MYIAGVVIGVPPWPPSELFAVSPPLHAPMATVVASNDDATSRDRSRCTIPPCPIVSGARRLRIEHRANLVGELVQTLLRRLLHADVDAAEQREPLDDEQRCVRVRG